MSIKRYTLTNLLGSIIPMFVLLVTVPLYLKVLGDVRYGVLALVWLMLGYFGFLEMGLGKSTANHIARLADSSDKERGTIFWTAISVNAGFGIFAALILWVIGDYLLTSVIKIPPEYHNEAVTALPWMIATLPLALVSSVLTGALEGRNQFLIVNSLQILNTVVFQLVPLFIAYSFSPSLSVVIPAAVLSRTLMNLPFLIACFRAVPLSLRPDFSKTVAKSLLSYGGWVAVTGMISPLLETIDRFLIGVVLGAQAVTYYTIPYQLVSKARIIPGSLGRALFPKFSADKPGDAEQLALSSLRTLVVVMTPVVVCGMLFLKPFMNVWVGGKLGGIASPLGEILLLGVWANSLAHIPYFLLQGNGRPDIAAKFNALEIIPFVLFLWVALHFWGAAGAAWAWSVRVIIDALLLFRFSGLPKKSLRMFVYPMFMVVTALCGVRCIANEVWYWRLILVILYVIWIGFWLKTNRGAELFSSLFSTRKSASKVTQDLDVTL
ncbi:MAG: flippase [Geobacter sp.]|nr:MAG: flippase [Geobacter sp.]